MEDMIEWVLWGMDSWLLLLASLVVLLVAGLCGWVLFKFVFLVKAVTNLAELFINLVKAATDWLKRQ